MAGKPAKLDGGLPRGLFVSVDVDSLHLYLGLYGKGSRADEGRLAELTWELGVRRFVELFGELGLRAVFFTVGKDLQHAGCRDVAREAVAAGHLLGNHTWSHPYDFIRLNDRAARDEVARAHDAVGEVMGRPPVIFRAPGYNMTEREYELLAEAGYRYDASPLPSYPYLLLKYAVMAFLTAAGRKSQSIWGSPGAFLGPRQPYRRAGLVVLPNAATPWLRLPVIGTSLSTAPGPLFNHLRAAVRHETFVSLEFHAVDLMELVRDPLPEALSSARDLAIPLESKRERFARFIGALQKMLPPFVPEER